MLSALATEMLAQAQVDEIRRLAASGESAHRYMEMNKKAKRAKKDPVQAPPFRQSWEDATYINSQGGGTAGARR